MKTLEQYGLHILNMIDDSGAYAPIFLQELLSYVSAIYTVDDEDESWAKPFVGLIDQNRFCNLQALAKYLTNSGCYDAYLNLVGMEQAIPITSDNLTLILGKITNQGLTKALQNTLTFQLFWCKKKL